MYKYVEAAKIALASILSHKLRSFLTLLGGVAPAVLSALISGLLLNYFFTPPLRSFTIAEPDNFITTVVLLVVAVAVAVLVDAAAKRAREARRASQEAELLALFAGSVLRGADNDHFTHGIQAVRALAGIDFRTTRDAAIGPFIGGDVNVMLFDHVDGGEMSTISPAVNTFITVGAMGRFDIGGSRTVPGATVTKRHASVD